MAGDLLLAANEAGKTYVLKAAPKFELVATNDLGENIMATPTVCAGKIYLRTAKNLYCIWRP